MMRGAGAEDTRAGVCPADVAATLTAAWDRARSLSLWCWLAAVRPYPAAPDAARMAAMADAVISGRRGRRRALRARGPAGGPASTETGSGRGSIADWAAVTSASSSAAVGRRPGSLARHRA